MKSIKQAFAIIELLVIIAIISILAAVVVGAGGGCSVSDGTRVGTITKMSHKGVINKSWEGELLMGGMRTSTDNKGNSSVVANVFPFSVMDTGIADQVQKAQGSGHRVKLVYKQTFLRNPLRRDTCYTITQVVDLDATAQPEAK